MIIPSRIRPYSQVARSPASLAAACQDRCILGIMTGDSYDFRTFEAEPEAFVLMESGAPPGEVEAVRGVLHDAGLDLPVDASLVRRSLGDPHRGCDRQLAFNAC